MKKWLVIVVFAIVVAAFTTLSNSSKKIDPEEINKAIDKSLPLLQSSSHTFLENAGGCQSCHHQDLTAVNLSLAKEKGFPVNDTILNEVFDSITSVMRSRKDILSENDDPVAIVMGGSYQLWAFWAN